MHSTLSVNIDGGGDASNTCKLWKFLVEFLLCLLHMYNCVIIWHTFMYIVDSSPQSFFVPREVQCYNNISCSEKACALCV